MKCQDVRRALSLLVEGQLPLTEWVMIQTHLRECADCREQLEAARAEVAARTRGRRRRVAVAGVAAVLIVGTGGFAALQWGGLPGLPRPDAVRLPSWGTAATPARPAAPEPAAAPAAGPTPAPTPTPAPMIVPPSPPTVRARPAVEPGVRLPAPPVNPTPEPAARATRPAATVEIPGEDRMPTQGRSPAITPAPPGAEAMPTQTPGRPRR
jgi:hypothetical protein